MSSDSILDEARAKLAEGNRAEAAGLLDAALRSRTALHSPDERMSLARLAEQAGALDVALHAYRSVLDQTPDHRDAHLRLARLRLDRGDADRAAALLRGWLDREAQDPEAHEILVEALADAGRLNEARLQLDALRDAGGDASALERWQVELANLLRDEANAQPASRDDVCATHGAETSLARPPGDEHPGHLDDLADPARPPAGCLPDADAISFWSCFAGREGVYARQWASPDGRRGYTPVHEPFTADVARQHLLGAITVGIYPVRLDQTTPFVALDLDVARFALAQSREDRAARRTWLQRSLDAAAALQQASRAQGLPALLEDSGNKGHHVWLLFAEPLPAAAARRLAQRLLEQVGPLPSGIEVEVFPKQSRVAADKLGNLIKLPLGVHRGTGRPCPLVDPQGTPLSRPIQALVSARTLNRAGLAERLDPSGTGQISTRGVAERVARDPGTGPPRSPGDHSEASRPVELEVSRRGASGYGHGLDRYLPERDLELQWLLERCPVLAQLTGQVTTRRQLDRQELLVLTYTLGHLSCGDKAVNHFVGLSLNLDHSARLKSRLRGNPMSCPKIRIKVPQLTSSVRCDCRFDPGSGHYPTPLLHLESLAHHGLAPRAPTHLSALQIERSVTEYLRVRAELTRLRALERQIERSLRQVFARQAIEELPTPAGVLRLCSDESGGLVLALPGTDGPPVAAEPAPPLEGPGSPDPITGEGRPGELEP